jgi:glycosyltransferase involved in cell wall biosynthesis
MRILAIDFNEQWSWGLTSRALYECLARTNDLRVIGIHEHRGSKGQDLDVDVILSQNITQVIERGGRVRVVQRLGGNRTFDGASAQAMKTMGDELGRCAAVIATNRYLYDLARRYNPNTYLVPNGIDLSLWRPGDRTIGASSPITVGFVGNVMTEWHASYKGFGLVTSACEALGLPLETALFRPGFKRARRLWFSATARSFLRIVGADVPPIGTAPSGTWMQAGLVGVRKMLRRPRTWPPVVAWAARSAFDLIRVSCLPAFGAGQIPHAKMPERFWHQVDVLVLPTAGEGCSNTIMEALACGVPVVTTRTAGFHGDLLTDGVNVVFCERTVDSVRQAIERLASSPELRQRLSVEGRRFAEAHHDIEHVAARYEEIFRACHSGTNGQAQKPQKVSVTGEQSAPGTAVVLAGAD